MDSERLKKIIAYNQTHRDEIASCVKRFCSYTEIDSNSEMLNFLQIVRPFLMRKGFYMFEIPLADEEIGAISYKGDGLGYVVLNTSLPASNMIFAIAHEVYHILFQKSLYYPKAEFAEEYYEHEEEFAANLFAGMLLMPETGFVRMYSKFLSESNGDIQDTFLMLMSYYKVPYMAVLIRSLELETCDCFKITKAILNYSKDQIVNRMSELWLDSSVMQPSYSDDSERMEQMVVKRGEEYIENGYISRQSVQAALSNMRTLSKRIKGGA